MSQIEYSKMSLLHYRIERGLVLTLQFSRGKYEFHTSLREIWTTQPIWATQSYFFPNPLYSHKILHCKFKYAEFFNFKGHINLLSSAFQQHFIKCFTVKF